MSDSLKQQSMRGVFWSFGGRISLQIVQFLVSLVLARLLTPEDYGVVGLAYVVIALVECFANLGLGGAIVQQKDVDDLDYCTFFWADAVMRCLVYAVIFIGAPLFAGYYHRPELVSIVRCIAISTPLGVMIAVPNLKLTRAMNFKTPAWIGMVSCFVSGALAMVAAFRGAGVWSLVVQGIAGTLLAVPLTLYCVPWCPKFHFSWERFHRFFNFGYKLLLSGILDTFYNNIASMIIGKAFSVRDLGLYSKGKHLPNMLMNAVNGPINSVSFPMLAKLQDDREKYRAALRKALRTSIFFVAPLLTGMAVVARPLVLVLYGEKWLPAVPFLRIMAVVFLFYPVHTLNLSALMGVGRTDLFFRLEIIKKIYVVAMMFATVPLGLMVFVYSSLVGTVVSIFINTWPLKKLIGYSTWQQMKDISRTLMGSFAMAGVLVGISFFPLRSIWMLLVQVPIGAAVYLLYNWLFDRALLQENFQLVRQFVQRKNNS